MDHEKVCSSSSTTVDIYSCNHCNRIFKSKKQYTRHQNYVSSYRDHHECPKKDCGQTFNCKSQLMSHLNVHSGARLFVCTFSGCKYRGGTRSQLAQHTITHGVGYIYVCEHCDYKATTSSNLRRHSRLHFNTRPYACPHCPHTFFEISSLRRHVLDSAHHPGLPLYVCPWCSAPQGDPSPVGFNSSTLAWRHLLSVHADKLKAPDTLHSIGRKPGETLIAHDVSLVFGLYRPQKDGKFRPSAEVRHSCSSIGASVMFAGKAPARLSRLSSKCVPSTTLPLSNTKETNSSPKSLADTRHNGIYDDNDASLSRPTSNLLGLSFREIQGIVMLPGEAIWSAKLLEAELSRPSSRQCIQNYL